MTSVLLTASVLILLAVVTTDVVVACSLSVVKDCNKREALHRGDG